MLDPVILAVIPNSVVGTPNPKKGVYSCSRTHLEADEGRLSTRRG